MCLFFIMKILTFIFFICFASSFSAQKQAFIYEMKYRPDIHNDSMVLKRMVLDISGNVSVFRTEQDRRSDSLISASGFGTGADQHIERQVYVTKDVISGKVTRNFRTRFNDLYDVKVEEALNWQVMPEKKKIGGFDTQKAVTDYGGRKWTVWFTEEIPVSDGPYIFHGLPGLIVKATDAGRDYEFMLIAAKNTSGNLFMRKKGLEMNFSDFKKLMMQYYSDPYADLKLRNMLPVYTSDGHGGKKAMDLNELTRKTQKMIRQYNNPIELNYKNEYREK